MQFFNPENQRIYIYGLFNGNECVYVGQAFDYGKRACTHRRAKDFEQVVKLRETIAKHAGRIEMQIVAAYKRRGQCQLNKAKATINYATQRSTNGQIIFLPKYGLAFASRGQVASFLNIGCIQTVRNHARSGDLAMIEIDPYTNQPKSANSGQQWLFLP